MSGGRAKCRAVRTETSEGRPGGCTANEDVKVLVRTPDAVHPGNYTFAKVGLCKFHCQQWLDHLQSPEENPPVRYKPWRPPTIEDLP